MATLTLNKGNYVIIGQEINGRYIENFGVIEDYTTNDGGWLKIKHLIFLNDMQEVNTIVQYSARELGGIPKLETFSIEEGEMIFNDLKRTVDRRVELDSPRQGRIITDTLDERNIRRDERELQEELVEPSPVEPPSEEQAVEASVQYQYPTVISEMEEVINIEQKSFTLSLEAGDMKTIMKIAEENPASVFNIIDQAIYNNGHITMQYIHNHLRGTFINLKLEQLKAFENIIPEREIIYKIYDENKSGYFKYLGLNFWLVWNNQGFDFNSEFILATDNYFDGYLIEKVIDQDAINAFNENFDSFIISKEVIEDIENNFEDKAIRVKLSEERSKITSEDLGKDWEKAIAYYYFVGGDLKWPEIDYSTFESASSLKKLAIARKDVELQQKLKTI